jgi:hypothetical protein
MPHLPQRPRPHVLEEESRRAWHAALPPEWVPRRVDPDYGIDETVEIFEEGVATGLIFNVQLRATDDSDPNSVLKLRLRDRPPPAARARTTTHPPPAQRRPQGTRSTARNGPAVLHNRASRLSASRRRVSLPLGRSRRTHRPTPNGIRRRRRPQPARASPGAHGRYP